MKVIAVDEETCQECADFLSLVEEAKKPKAPTQHEYGPASKEAAERQGFEPFNYTERS